MIVDKPWRRCNWTLHLQHGSIRCARCVKHKQRHVSSLHGKRITFNNKESRESKKDLDP